MRYSVLGAGVAGLCCATALVARRLPVEIILPDDAPTPASDMAGGMLAPFCEGESATDQIVAQGRGAADWWQAQGARVHRCGTLVLAPMRDTGELDRFARATGGHQWVDPGVIEPALAGRFTRGLFFAEEAHLDPVQALSALRRKLGKQGVTFHDASPTGQIIDCRGMAAADRLPDLRAVRGEMLVIRAPDVTLTRPVRLLHPRFPCYIVPRGQGTYMIGATMVESADTAPITARAVVELLSAAYTVHPGFAEAQLVQTGAGLRPAFPDNIPGIRHAGGRIHVNGMYRHGFLMAPALAMQLARQLTATPTKEPAHAD